MSFLRDIFNTIQTFFNNRAEARRIKLEREREERKRLAEFERQKQEYERGLYRIGNEFESYVISLFDPTIFKLIHRTPTNDETNGKYVSSMVLPDLKFKEISTGREFWVECKYRSRTEERRSITWCSDTNLRNYKKTMYRTKDPVFIVIGLGGSNTNPEKLFCLNLERINFTKLYYGTYCNNVLNPNELNSLNYLYYVDLLGQ